MPLPESRQVVDTAEQLVQTLRGAFGTPEAFRPAHAKGRLTKGVFTPTPEAAELSKAPHFHRPSTPVLVRFSNSTGVPSIPDTDPNANPRGIAIRFVLGDDGHRHTDIIAHSTKGFPTRTGEEFLEFLQAVGDGTIGTFLAEHPAAAAFVNEPKPFPESFATDKYFGVNAFKFISPSGKETFIRYRILPQSYSTFSSDVTTKSATYLFDDLPSRLPFTLKLVAQIAEPGDVTDDATKFWPEERKQVELGSIEVKEVEGEEESLKEQKRMIFDPIPRVEGIEASEDPLLDVRAAVYLISGRVRRGAPEE